MDTPIRITDPVDYWQMRAIVRDVQAAELQAVQARALAERAVLDAKKASNALMDALGKKYGFDPATTFVWDDATQTLTVAQPAPKGGA